LKKSRVCAFVLKMLLLAGPSGGSLCNNINLLLICICSEKSCTYHVINWTPLLKTNEKQNPCL
jgi:hypothetical protein